MVEALVSWIPEDDIHDKDDICDHYYQKSSTIEVGKLLPVLLQVGLFQGEFENSKRGNGC